MNRLRVLDGWRGISIALVLAGHLFPLGPKPWQMNYAVAGMGMAIFFQLSGFLITSVLLRDDSTRRFLIHRFMRIVPLAWLATLITLSAEGSGWHTWLAHLFFYANWAPMPLTVATQHFWSLCVEVQFYVFVAFLVAIGGRRALWLLPLVAVIVTALRVHDGRLMTIDTQYRADEILAGCLLALAFHARPEAFSRRWLAWLPFVAAPLLLLSAHPASGAFNYARPYVATVMIGSTLGLADGQRLRQLLESRVLRYLALVSYALYIIHGCLMGSWLGEGGTLEKYLKRPVLLLVTFGLAHLSTKYYEKYFIDLGHKWAGPRPARPEPANGGSGRMQGPAQD